MSVRKKVVRDNTLVKRPILKRAKKVTVAAAKKKNSTIKNIPKKYKKVKGSSGSLGLIGGGVAGGIKAVSKYVAKKVAKKAVLKTAVSATKNAKKKKTTSKKRV
tara:strand:+ start:71 stop:382 length:312 start_codon:yes stop_codon:yes gene_type:complete